MTSDITRRLVNVRPGDLVLLIAKNDDSSDSGIVSIAKKVHFKEPGKSENTLRVETEDGNLYIESDYKHLSLTNPKRYAGRFLLPHAIEFPGNAIITCAPIEVYVGIEEILEALSSHSSLYPYASTFKKR
ncbi:MAG: hypothetical protein Q8N99_05590 [Nanoarchaeota archaeon]|nr:hypothetical protein [Nanoarchaeota archaeon]